MIFRQGPNTSTLDVMAIGLKLLASLCNGPKPCYLIYRYVQKNSLKKGR